MEKNSDIYIKIKVAISLKKLLTDNDSSGNTTANSYGKVSNNAEIRKATVTNTLNAKSLPDTRTLIIIIEAMGYSLSDFAKVYESVDDAEINIFEKVLQYKNKK